MSIIMPRGQVWLQDSVQYIKGKYAKMPPVCNRDIVFISIVRPSSNLMLKGIQGFVGVLSTPSRKATMYSARTLRVVFCNKSEYVHCQKSFTVQLFNGAMQLSNFVSYANLEIFRSNETKDNNSLRA